MKHYHLPHLPPVGAGEDGGDAGGAAARVPGAAAGVQHARPGPGRPPAQRRGPLAVVGGGRAPRGSPAPRRAAGHARAAAAAVTSCQGWHRSPVDQGQHGVGGVGAGARHHPGTPRHLPAVVVPGVVPGVRGTTPGPHYTMLVLVPLVVTVVVPLQASVPVLAPQPQRAARLVGAGRGIQGGAGRGGVAGGAGQQPRHAAAGPAHHHRVSTRGEQPALRNRGIK